jgi:hypothetical protein
MEKYLYIAATVGLTVFGQLVVKGRSVVHSPAGESGKLALLWQNLAIDWRNWIPESDFQ